MRRFSHFLFENFDADEQWNNPMNPRAFLNDQADEVLSFVAGFPAGSCDSQEMMDRFGESIVHTLLEGGILRREGNSILFDTPIFLREDARVLPGAMNASAEKLASQLEASIPEIHRVCEALDNGFPIEVNLYHILCGMVFDGSFFDELERRSAVATSRQHNSGLDYISVLYEQCPELNAYADGLLCSYNRFANERCSLQSFGDSNGNRHDFYRFFRLRESGHLPVSFQNAETLLNSTGGMGKAELLGTVSEFLSRGSCPESVNGLLEEFGYTKNGSVCVPVYTKADRTAIREIGEIIARDLGAAFAEELKTLSGQLDITARYHGIAPGELANELYHILFGSINEVLVRRGIAAQPPDIPGQGRFLRCIQLEN